MDGFNNILKQFSIEDIEKLKVLLSIIPSQDQKEVITLRVFSEEYSNLIKENRSAAYHKSVIASLKHLTDYFGNQKPIHTLGLKDIESFISDIQRKVVKGYRVYVKTLKAAFNKAVDWSYVKENYFLKVKLPKKPKLNPAYIDENNLAVICENINADVVRDFVVTAFYTGMRLNELVNLTWRNVNLTARIITVGDEEFTTKGRNQRYIPICDEALTSILSQRENKKIIPIGSNYVFSKPNGEKYTGDYFSKAFKKACRTAGIDKSIHFHSLRHSFASNLAQKGVSLYTIKELLGHSSISTTEIYSHLNMDSLKEAIRKFDHGQLQDYSLSQSFGGQSRLKDS
ncbi:MAG TPA: site-specific integrase [Ignavibacteriaceae bacterium]|nr:site-specific integrase [Ignavibacteriaceae bacterium]